MPGKVIIDLDAQISETRENGNEEKKKTAMMRWKENNKYARYTQI
jgi:hypothetical protein